MSSDVDAEGDVDEVGVARSAVVSGVAVAEEPAGGDDPAADPASAVAAVDWLSQGMGVSRAPPRASSLPGVAHCEGTGTGAVLLPPSDTPFDMSVPLKFSSAAGGSG